MAKISFVTFIAAEEISDIRTSINCLLSAYMPGDEILIVIDDEHYHKQADTFISKILFEFEAYDIRVLHHSLNMDFAAHRNFAIENSKCDYIFMLDADEYINYHYIRELHNIKDGVRVVAFPRINEIIGFTEEDIKRYNFNIDRRLGWYNYPDYQLRFFKNCSNIRYTRNRKVHEALTEPANVITKAHIHHTKTAERQRKQNKFYDSFSSES